VHERAGKLLDILLMRDDDLVPLFHTALIVTDQVDVIHRLRYQGLYIFGVLLVSGF